MKPLIVWMIDSLGHGGAEKLTLEILKNFDKDKFDLRVCVLQERSGNPIEKELKHINIPVDMVSVPYLSHPLNFPKILNYLHIKRPNVIHTQLQFADALGNLCAAILGIPSFSTLHTIDELTYKDGKEYWREKLTWFFLKYFCGKIIAVSENARQFYIKHWGAPGNKIITLYNGINLSHFKESTMLDVVEKKRSLNLPSDGILFTTVAVLREPKGIQYMLKAVPEILKKEPNFYYLVVGDGNHAGHLKEITRSLKIEEHVIFTGQRTDIREILAISDAFVLPTLTEALPTVLIEAMAAQKAIIASTVGGIPEMVIEGVNGLLVQPGNSTQLEKACIQLAQDKVLRDMMGKQGYGIAFNKFNLDTLIRNLSNEYEEAIANGR